ncbi:MAG: acetylxylan esterase [Planctomycetales bacterium]|nr:acetylxylan esterase [Planctomycetales bacterium]
MKVSIAILVAFSFLRVSQSHADIPRAVPEGESINDWRLKPLKDLDGYFPFEPSKSKDAWNARADSIRRRILVANGLWPMPTKTPLNAVVHGKIDFDDYSVEKVYFESMPGLYVTGNLYRPKNVSGKVPAVLCPHGHFADGRFGASGIESVRTSITQGAERFEDGGQNSIQARCVGLARLGCVVFNYDMIGYCDSTPISYELAHRFAKQRPEMNSKSNWGLFSPQAESRAQSVMGMQTYNSIRALDWIETLPDVDSKRIAVTGASGGGTQTFLLSAIDPRVAVSVPAVMVSTAMQGGCTCENCTLLRVGDSGNVTFAALFAPKPLCVISANDWTVEMPTKGFPQLQQHFKMMGASDNVHHVPLLHFGHNYNYVSRANMYVWMNKHLQLGHKEPIVEEAYKRLTRNELSVWDDDHPKPPATAEAERNLLKWWTADAEKQVADARADVSSYKKLVGGALETLIHRKASDIGKLELTSIGKHQHDNYIEITGLIHHPTSDGDEFVPTVSLMPNDWENGKVVVGFNPNGKAALYDSNGDLHESVKRLLKKGVAILVADLFMQGEFLKDGEPITKTRRVGNTREAAAYSFGYNDTLFVRRVHDVLTTVAFVANHERNPSKITLLGLGSAGPIVAAARTACGDLVDDTIIHSDGFRFASVDRIHDPNFVPAAAKYDDLPGILAICAPAKMVVFGETADAKSIVSSIYKLSGAEDAISFESSQGLFELIAERIVE